MKFSTISLSVLLSLAASVALAQTPPIIYPPCTPTYCPVPAPDLTPATKADLNQGLGNIFGTLSRDYRDLFNQNAAAITSNFDLLNQKIDFNDRRAQKSTAISNALSQQTPSLSNGETAFSVGVGGSGREIGVGVGVSHLTRNNVLLSGSVGTAGNSQTGWKVGSSFKF